MRVLKLKCRKLIKGDKIEDTCYDVIDEEDDDNNEGGGYVTRNSNRFGVSSSLP